MSDNIKQMLGLERPPNRPAPARRRFSPTNESEDFLVECENRGWDISTIINIAISTFKPKTTSNGFTWEGIDKFVTDKSK